MLYYHFSYREQMAKEMSEILSRLVQCNLGEKCNLKIIFLNYSSLLGPEPVI